MGKYVKKIFAGSSNPQLATKIAAECGVSLGELSIKRFSDGEICYNDKQRFDIKNLSESQFGSVTLHTAFQIAQLFNERRMNLKHGYQDDHPDFNPVQNLTPANFPLEYQGGF